MWIATTAGWMSWRFPPAAFGLIKRRQERFNFLELSLELSEGFDLFLKLFLSLQQELALSAHAAVVMPADRDLTSTSMPSCWRRCCS